MTQRIVFVSGNFDVLHPGHLRLLRFARECGDRLIVAVQSDRIAGKAAHVAENLRLQGVLETQWVDEAFICDEPVINAIARLKPSVVVKGREHESQFNPEKSVLESYGGQLIFSSGEAVTASDDLLQSGILEVNPSAATTLAAYAARHDFDLASLAALTTRFSSLKLCVIGDLIVDEYITCEALGMSQEDPSLVVTPIGAMKFLGGAGIVAAHAAGLGAKVDFISICGNDDVGTFAKDKLREYGVASHLFIDANRPTTLKQRYRSKEKTLLRVSHLYQNSISSDLQADVLAKAEKLLESADILVFSDFNYGCLPQRLVDDITALANKHGVMTVADSQCSSQMGNVGRFHGMSLLTPTEREARMSTRNYEDGLVVLAESLRQQSQAKNIFLKLGEEGVLVHAETSDQEYWLTDRIEALNPSPKDAAGAGDALFIASALSMAVENDIWKAACVGSIAAAIQVGRVGNLPLQTSSLQNYLHRLAQAVRNEDDSSADERSQARSR